MEVKFFHKVVLVLSPTCTNHLIFTQIKSSQLTASCVNASMHISNWLKRNRLTKVATSKWSLTSTFVVHCCCSLLLFIVVVYCCCSLLFIVVHCCCSLLVSQVIIRCWHYHYLLNEPWLHLQMFIKFSFIKLLTEALSSREELDTNLMYYKCIISPKNSSTINIALFPDPTFRCLQFGKAVEGLEYFIT